MYKIKGCLKSDVLSTTVNNTGLDSDVIEEKKRIKAMSKSEIQSQSLVMQNMTKSYGKLLAVNQLTVGVDQLVYNRISHIPDGISH